MGDILTLIQKRQSSRTLFDPKKKIPKKDIQKILEAARWAPTAHNMQNYEVMVVDDKKLLNKISELHNPISLTFVRENYQQLSFSEAELRRKKVGVLGTMFPPSWRKPNASAKEIRSEERGSFQARQIGSSSALCVMLYDPKRRAPASEHDFLGAISLGCVMENMWLMAESLGIGFHIISALSEGAVEKKIKQILHVPNRFHIAISFRLGYPVAPRKYLRVRRDTKKFTHHNAY
jgi:nitroreductase